MKVRRAIVEVTTTFMHHLTYVRLKRKSWALHQQELARLLGIAESALCRIEQGLREPDLETALGLQVVFGDTARDLFPSHYEWIQDAVMRRAAEFERDLGSSSDESTNRKRALLADMGARATANDDSV